MHALLAAALFGASIPFAKTLVGQVALVVLARLLCLGSGLGLLACFGVYAVLTHKSADMRIPIIPTSTTGTIIYKSVQKAN